MYETEYEFFISSFEFNCQILYFAKHNKINGFKYKPSSNEALISTINIEQISEANTEILAMLKANKPLISIIEKRHKKDILSAILEKEIKKINQQNLVLSCSLVQAKQNQNGWNITLIVQSQNPLSKSENL